MNGQTQNTVIEIGLIILVILLFALAAFRAVIILGNISGDITNDKICQLEYGDNWVYENDDVFGRLCMELDYESLDVVNRMKLNITMREAVSKYCDSPGFFELSRWDDGCIK